MTNRTWWRPSTVWACTPSPPEHCQGQVKLHCLSMEGWKELDLSLVITKAVRNVYTDIPVLHLQSGCECLSSRHHVESLCTLLGSMTNKKSPCLKKKIKYVFLGPMSQTINTDFFRLREKVFLGRCQMKMLQRKTCGLSGPPLFPIYSGIQALCWPCTT